MLVDQTKIIAAPTRADFRLWLQDHSPNEEDCFVAVLRGKPKDDGALYYVDAVEEALCFGYIDSVQINEDGVTYQRFSPRTSRSPWTELNKERARRLIRLGLMTKRGEKALPKMGPRSFQPDAEVVEALKKARVWKRFCAFPPLYQRVRLYNVAFYKSLDQESYRKALTRLISATKRGEMYGQWNDYGRLLEE